MKARYLAGLVLAWLLAGPVAAQGVAPTAGAAPITLLPGDIVRVQVWREEDLTGEFLVNERGIVTLPLLGERQVGGVPWERLRDTLVAEYRAQLRNPSITLTPLRRVTVLGEVQKPGLYPVDPTVSLAAAVALAGGTTPNGDLRRIRIVRNGTTHLERASAAATISDADIRSGDQILVERRGWFDRNSTFVVSALLSVTSVVISIVNR